MGTGIGSGMGGAMGCGHPRWWTLQHHSFLSAFHVFSGSTAQLKGSTGPDGAGGAIGRGAVGGGVGGGVGGKVGGGVGGCVGAGSNVAGCVMMHPLPMVVQQYSCCAGDQADSQFMKPDSQSYSPVETVLDNNQSKRGISSKRLRRQHVVIRHVKSLLGRTASKSPPQPTYL